MAPSLPPLMPCQASEMGTYKIGRATTLEAVKVVDRVGGPAAGESEENG